MTWQLRFRRVLSLILILCVDSVLADDDTFLQPHSASYEAHISHGLSLDGEAQRELVQQEDGSWFYRFNVDTTPAEITEQSVFDLIDRKIRPKSYDYLLSGFLIKDRHQSVVFDQNTGTLNEKYKKKQWSLDTLPGTLDRLNYQLQLQLDVGAGKQDLVYQVIHKGKFREYRFQILGKESIDTKLGTKEAIVVEKVRDGGKQRETKLWFDQSAPFALLKMIQTEPDGEYYEINITELRASDTANSDK
jgi:hypothetical protein